MKIQPPLLFLFGLFSIVLGSRAASAQSGVTASPSSLQFGGVGVDTFSEPQSVTLTHSEAGDGEIGIIGLAGEEPQQYLIVTDDCSTRILGMGESCEIEVVYGPQFDLPGGVGDATALLLIPFVSSPALSVGLDGSGLLPLITSNVTAMTFKELTVGKISDSSDLTIQNLGEADLDINLVEITGTNALSFNIQSDNCSFQTLAPEDYCNLEVAFRPLVIGDLASTLIVSSGDPVTPFFSVALNGKGKGSGGCSLSAGEGTDGQIGAWTFLAIAAGAALLRGLAVRDAR